MYKFKSMFHDAVLGWTVTKNEWSLPRVMSYGYEICDRNGERTIYVLSSYGQHGKHEGVIVSMSIDGGCSKRSFSIKDNGPKIIALLDWAADYPEVDASTRAYIHGHSKKSK